MLASSSFSNLTKQKKTCEKGACVLNSILSVTEKANSVEQNCFKGAGCSVTFHEKGTQSMHVNPTSRKASLERQ